MNQNFRRCDRTYQKSSLTSAGNSNGFHRSTKESCDSIQSFSPSSKNDLHHQQTTTSSKVNQRSWNKTTRFLTWTQLFPWSVHYSRTSHRPPGRFRCGWVSQGPLMCRVLGGFIPVIQRRGPVVSEPNCTTGVRARVSWFPSVSNTSYLVSVSSSRIVTLFLLKDRRPWVSGFLVI